MKFSTKSRYALRFMIDLAKQNQSNYIALKDISKRQEISIKYLEQIVSQLSKAGLLISTRGAQGGHRLAKPASEITAGDILRATEGNLAPVACLRECAETCTRVSVCQSLDFWKGLHQVFSDYANNITLDSLTQSGCHIEYSDFCI